jgi:hypothetical protein
MPDVHETSSSDACGEDPRTDKALSMWAAFHFSGPPVGSVDTTTFPLYVVATHRSRVLHDTAVRKSRSTSGGGAGMLYLDVQPWRRLEVTMLSPVSETHNWLDGHDIPRPPVYTHGARVDHADAPSAG